LTHFALDGPRFVAVKWGDSPCANQSTVLTYRVWALGDGQIPPQWKQGWHPTMEIEAHDGNRGVTPRRNF